MIMRELPKRGIEEGKCVSCDVSHEDMMKSGNAVFLNKVMLESAANENDGKSLKFECCLVIEKKQLTCTLVMFKKSQVQH